MSSRESTVAPGNRVREEALHLWNATASFPACKKGRHASDSKCLVFLKCGGFRLPHFHNWLPAELGLGLLPGDFQFTSGRFRADPYKNYMAISTNWGPFCESTSSKRPTIWGIWVPCYSKPPMYSGTRPFEKTHWKLSHIWLAYS